MKHVRDGQLVWPYCPDCGCRLEMTEEEGLYYFQHYEGRIALFGETGTFVFIDARGCICTNNIWALDNRVVYQGMFN